MFKRIWFDFVKSCSFSGEDDTVISYTIHSKIQVVRPTTIDSHYNDSSFIEIKECYIASSTQPLGPIETVLNKKKLMILYFMHLLIAIMLEINYNV